MKQTFYVYKNITQGISPGKIKIFAQEVSSLRNDRFHDLIGTIELDVMPIKKEVERVISISTLSMDSCVLGSATYVRTRVPNDAYDVKVVYKIKE